MDSAGPQPGYCQSGTRQKAKVSLENLSHKFDSLVLCLVTLIIHNWDLHVLIAFFFLIISSKSIAPQWIKGGRSRRSLAGGQGRCTKPRRGGARE